ncbi:hypothetical protein CR205_12820 [Alteribacter lacisalsi]|uniref:Uncharacterized protein n=1 Tax=Alteribacter lacisalsi TaxID=2045244 RepID=A0A2W0H646_9BACI|nr:hypothetical protein [Alteribacter lacisalsi]PYZ96587.1 hypothetical protein CR205_12820 [Alteribacter lacisalsi]
MRTLSLQKYRRAADFVSNHARLVDQRLFEYYFYNGSSEAVLEALIPYQNEDGGIGRGIEPDLRTQASTPIATSVALQYARKVGASWKHPFIQKAMAYLHDVYRQYGFWPLKIPEINDVPHAEWWHFTSQADTFEVNPGAEIIGYFHAYPQVLEADLFSIWHEQIFTWLEGDGPLEMHDALCFLRLAELMPQPGKSQILDALRPHIRSTVTRDPMKWSSYCAKPLWFAPTPDSPFASLLEHSIRQNLDYEVCSQQPDGSWNPFWAWGQYEDVWETKAKKEWAGILTVKTLKTLADYKRIEGLVPEKK